MITSNVKIKLYFLLKIILIYLFISLKSYSSNIDNGLVVLGSYDAPVKIKVFSSLTCPHCANFHLKIIPKIKEKYIEKGQVQIIFFDFPLDQAAFNASKLIQCLDKKKQISYMDIIYKTQSKWTSGSNINDINNNLKKIVKGLGINSSEFDKCLINEDISDKILKHRIDAHKKYFIDSTPTIIINEKKLDGSAIFKNIENKINKLL